MAKFEDYRITSKAGRFVAGQRNTGVGTVIRLTDKQAEAALRGGHVAKVTADGDPSEARTASKETASAAKKADDAKK